MEAQHRLGEAGRVMVHRRRMLPEGDRRPIDRLARQGRLDPLALGHGGPLRSE
jgi:hypothetical protein